MDIAAIRSEYKKNPPVELSQPNRGKRLRYDYGLSGLSSCLLYTSLENFGYGDGMDLRTDGQGFREDENRYRKMCIRDRD